MKTAERGARPHAASGRIGGVAHRRLLHLAAPPTGHPVPPLTAPTIADAVGILYSLLATFCPTKRRVVRGTKESEQRSCSQEQAEWGLWAKQEKKSGTQKKLA